MLETRREGSFLWPLFKMLPMDGFSTLLEQWPSYLESLMPERILFLRHDAQRSFENLLNKLSLVSDVDREDVYHSFAILTTRQVEIGRPKRWRYPSWFSPSEYCPVIVPMFDMINHSDTPNSQWDLMSDGVAVKTIRQIREGEEITIRYPQFTIPTIIKGRDRQTVPYSAEFDFARKMRGKGNKILNRGTENGCPFAHLWLSTSIFRPDPASQLLWLLVHLIQRCPPKFKFFFCFQKHKLCN